jgi:hypothetical protein
MIYEIHMSKGDNIKIDEEDLQKVKDNISAPLIQVKQAILNPSFMVSITPTKEKEFYLKDVVEVSSGIAKIVGQEKIKLLSDEMSMTKKLSTVAH